ncbi:MAG: aminopeptidase N [Bdellovibrionales bacterium]|nr:aminopeptidase N [Bdellovibrionales bacterium]
MKNFIFCVAVSASLLVSCQKTNSSSPATYVDGVLTQKQAAQRAARVSDVRYQVVLNLLQDATGKTPNFSGEVLAQFNLSAAHHQEDLILDLAREMKISGLEINGRALSEEQLKKVQAQASAEGHLLLTGTMLAAGANSVKVVYSAPYSDSGSGLYRFKDPEDGKFYLYTNLEPYDANRVFPCFDQPDLKAVFNTQVRVPSEWTVVSNTREKTVTQEKDGISQWTFNESAKFSTYLFQVSAGHYKVWESVSVDGSNRVPLRLFARQSLAKYVQPEVWFTVTKQGLSFFSKYFDFPYPFKKYDQIIVPDFSSGAMENVAAVTFSERYVHRGGMTRNQKEDLYEVVLHEMAHMWFGDLVTMVWWNDLWLNESFASFMASTATAAATEFKDGWKTFALSDKPWAYWSDQLVTTHPIETEVASTAVASSNFDGITYGKGASVIKALNYYLTPEKFKEGVQAYFKKHQYKNATLKDFIAALAEASKTNLDQWTHDWLQTSGVAVIEDQLTCKDGKIEKLSLKQIPSKEYPKVREYRFLVGLFYKDAKGMIQVQKKFPVKMTAEHSLTEAVGLKCPDLVFANLEDHAYARLKFDPISVATIESGLGKFEDPMVRGMVAAAMQDLLKDGDWATQAYAGMAIRALSTESDLRVAEQLGGSLVGRRPGDSGHLVYLAPEERKPVIQQLHDVYLKRLPMAKPGSDDQKAWMDGLIVTSFEKAQQERLIQWLSGSDQKLKESMDQERRWRILTQLKRVGNPEADSRIQEEAKKDGSSRGELSRLAAESIGAGLENKKKWIREIGKGSKMNLAKTRAISGALFPLEQENDQVAMSEELIKTIADVVSEKSEDFGRAVAQSILPANCNPESAKRMDKMIQGKELGNLPPVVDKAVRVSIQALKRCLVAREVSGRYKAQSGNL